MRTDVVTVHDGDDGKVKHQGRQLSSSVVVHTHYGEEFLDIKISTIKCAGLRSKYVGLLLKNMLPYTVVCEITSTKLIIASINALLSI